MSRVCGRASRGRLDTGDVLRSRQGSHYDLLKIGDLTEIEFFDGPRTINGKGTDRFLHLREPALENRLPLLENGVKEGPITSGVEMERLALSPEPHQSPAVESLGFQVRVGQTRRAIPDGQGRGGQHLCLDADQSVSGLLGASERLDQPRALEPKPAKLCGGGLQGTLPLGLLLVLLVRVRRLLEQ